VLLPGTDQLNHLDFIQGDANDIPEYPNRVKVAFPGNLQFANK